MAGEIGLLKGGTAMGKNSHKILIVLILVLGCTFPAAAQENLKFREIGPAIMGGRVDDFAVVESNPKVVYAAMASGGLWKTTNAGTTWEPVFDDQAAASIGDVAIAPSDPSIIWVGTGEPNNRQSSSWGNGVYRSLDGGETWENMGLKDTHHIGRICIHPSDPNVVYVAGVGHLWGPNEERGVFKTTDGGITWSKVLYIDEDTGATDLVIDPESPGTLYAAAYQRRRSPWGYNGSGPGSGIYKTIDAGKTWTKLSRGLPYEGETESQTGRIGLDIYRGNPDIVYAIVEHAEGGVFRSEDRGKTWERMSAVNPRPAYYSQIRVDPNNDLRVYILGMPFFRSEDGGRTFEWNEFGDPDNRIHVDNHALWINPYDSKHMLLGTDGGIHWSWDAGRTWEFVNTIATGQFYEVGYDMQKPYRVSGGLQDNGSWVGPSMSLTKWGYWLPPGSSNRDWTSIHGSDGYYTVIDPVNPDIIYAETPDGNPIRRNMKTTEARVIRPREKEGDPRYRFYWDTPLVISHFDHKTIYYASQFLFRSTDQGDSWTRISPDLTTGIEQNSLPTMGRLPDEKMMSRQDGVWNYACITVIAESPLDANEVWVGTDDGYLQVTRDLGKTWENVTSRIPGLPEKTCAARIVPSQHAPGTVYAAFDAHRLDDFSPYIYVTKDYGKTWKHIVKGLPQDNAAVHALCEHHRSPGLLFTGTETGLFVSYDSGTEWQPLESNLPTVPVYDIKVHPRENDLILGTHGRSIWILDDINALEAIAAGKTDKPVHLCDMRTAVSWRIYDDRRDHGNPGHKFFYAENPPYGALITYYLQSAAEAKTPVRFTITDGDGNYIREFEDLGEAGFNRTAWDLRLSLPPDEEGAAGRGRFSQGPIVEPGFYTVTLSVGNDEESKPVTVEEDPRIDASAAERTARFDTLMKLLKLRTRVFSSMRNLSELRDALAESMIEWDADKDISIPSNIKEAADELMQKSEKLWERFSRPRLWLGSSSPPLEWKPPTLPSQVSRLYGAIEGYTAAPTPPQMAELSEVTTLTEETEAAISGLIEKDLAELNHRLAEAGIPYIK